MDANRPSPILVAVGGLLAMAAAMGIGRFVYTPILPFMVDAIPLSGADAGLIATINFLGYLMGALGASTGLLPGSHRVWFLGALFVSALTTAAMGLTQSTSVFMVLRFVGGIASAFVLVFSSALILERLNAAGRAGLSSIHFAGVGIGIALSALLVAGLAHAGLAWPYQWVASGAMTLLFLVAAALLVPSDKSVGAASTAPRERMGRPGGPLLRLIVAYGLFGLGYIITATFIAVIVRDTPALNAAEPYVWLVVGLAAIPSVYVWNQVTARMGGRPAFALACVIQSIGVTLSVIAGSPLVVLLAAALLGGTFMGLTAMGLIEARRLAVTGAHQALGVMTASFGVGQMAGPWIAGLLSEATGGYSIASFMAAGALIVAAVLVWR